MFDIFKRIPPAEPRKVVVVPQRPMINLKKETRGEFRNGMWVTVGDPARVGILTDSNEFGIAAVMLVQEDGTNLLEIHAPLSELRQATHAEIPAKRRPTEEHAVRLGYKVTT